MNQFVLDCWSKTDYDNFLFYLKQNAEIDYQKFQSTLIPDIPILGVRYPLLHRISKKIVKGNALSFLSIERNNFLEEILVQGFVIGLLSLPYEDTVLLIDSFVPRIDNWSVCDSFCNCLKFIPVQSDKFFQHLESHLLSDNPWALRFSLVVMLFYYLNDAFIDDVFIRCDRIRSEHYYVKMAQAWLLAEAYSKFPEKTSAYFSNSNLDQWTLQKAFQKIRESRKISKENKTLLQVRFQ